LESFNLEQERATMELLVKIHRPFVIIKDRPYSENFIEIDLGEIGITSEENKQ